ncbi:hypothetical protein M885DRAFT_539178, partial [Pelagophyceae sp. CCMP2097]
MATAPAWFDVESPESDASFDEAEVAAALLARRPCGVRGVAPQAVLARSAATAATKRAAKARTDAQRKDDAKSSAQEAGLPRVPGPLALLRTLTWTYELVPREEAREGTNVSRVDSKANAEVLISELCEVLPQPARYMVSGGVHPKSGQRPCSTLFTLGAVCIHPNCGFVAKWKRGGGGGGRRLCDTAAPIGLFCSAYPGTSPAPAHARPRSRGTAMPPNPRRILSGTSCRPSASRATVFMPSP